MRAALTIIAVLGACGRIGFDEVGDDDGGALRCEPFVAPDLSNARVVGDGTAASCTEASLRAGLAGGGVVRLECGGMTGTIPLTTEIVIDDDTVLDAGSTQISGQNLTRIFRVALPGSALTLLNGWLVRGNAGMQSGGAVLVEAGSFTASNTIFDANTAVPLADISGGGAIAALPPSATLAIYDSLFSNNGGANGGAVLVFGDATFVDSTFLGNMATGSGGSMANGGIGGALSVAGNGDLAMCGDVLMSNFAGNVGGALSRVSIDNTAIDRMDRVRIEANTASSGAGGAYIQGSTLTMRQVSFAFNIGNPVGGLWVQNGVAFNGQNIVATDNRSSGGLGAGLLISSPGTLAFSSITNNHAQCPTCFSAAIEAAQDLTLVSTVVANNLADAVSTPASCRVSGNDGGSNFQWPAETPLCASGALVVDPLLAPLLQTSGPAGDHSVRRPLPGSPVIGAATSCPLVDILGNPRPTPCAAGAVEP